MRMRQPLLALVVGDVHPLRPNRRHKHLTAPDGPLDLFHKIDAKIHGVHIPKDRLRAKMLAQLLIYRQRIPTAIFMPVI